MRRPEQLQYTLHIGMGKTGSTALQHALSVNREALRKFGVIYPTTFTGKKNMQNRHTKLRQAMIRDMPVDWIESFRSETAGADICVLSDEELSILPERDSNFNPERITSLIPRDRTRVVMYIREPVSWIASRYQEKIKNTKATMSLRQFSRRNGIPYLSVAEQWSRVFGRENVMIRIYQRDHFDWDIFSDFVDVIGLKWENVFPNFVAREYESNPGMAGNLLYVKRVLNEFISDEESRSIADDFAELKYLDERFRGKIPVDQETVNTIANHSRENLERLDRLFGVSVIPRDKPVEASPCPDHDKLAHDFAQIQTWARARNGALAPLLERVSGMFAAD